MNALDQIIADALAGSPETHVAMLAREVVRLRAAHAVVVPEIPKRITHCNAVKKVDLWRAYEELDKVARAISALLPSPSVLGKGMVAVTWIPVDEALPEDGQTVGFVTECANDKWYHGRVLGGRYMAGEFGGFSVPGLMVQASHWFAFPPLPDTLRANQGGLNHD